MFREKTNIFTCTEAIVRRVMAEKARATTLAFEVLRG